MDSNTDLKNYSDEIPLEIKTLLKGLAGDDRLGILIALMKNGKMSFNEMKERFGLHSSSLTNHLTVLQNGNLIENFYEKNSEKGFSYYNVTEIPEVVFDALFDIMYKPITEYEEYTKDSEEVGIKSIESGSTPSFEKELEGWSKTPKKIRRDVHRQRLVTTSTNSERFDVVGS